MFHTLCLTYVGECLQTYGYDLNDGTLTNIDDKEQIYNIFMQRVCKILRAIQCHISTIKSRNYFL